MKINEKIKELMIENDLTVKDVCDALGRELVTVYDWLSGKHTPRADDMFKLSNLFNCSIDYLLGRTENYEEIKQKDMPDFSAQIDKVLKEQKVSKYKISKNKVLTNGAVYGLFNNGATPTIETIVKIADYLGVSVDYLVGRV